MRQADSETRHWKRPLKDGGFEFFMRANGQTMSGSATGFTYTDLRARFEQALGATRASEIKPMKGLRP
ncbi:MAG: hypothetical protein ACRDQH_06115 [Pseudonocardiaceae bacterium]